MRPITVTVGPVGTVSANNIALSQTPGAAGALTLNGALVSGGVAVLPTPQRILATTADSTHVLTIVGQTSTGTALTETLALNGSTAQSTLDYAKVTSITINAAATAAITVGTNGVASTPWVRLDEWANSECSIQCNVTGTVNYTVQVTDDDPNSATDPVAPSAVSWLTTNDPNVVGATTSQQTNFFFSPTFARVLLNSGAGSVTAKFIQYNVANR